MKKLVLLMMVMSMASFASAGYYFTISAPAEVDAGTTFAVSILAGDGTTVDTMLNTVLSVDSAASVSNLVIADNNAWSTVAAAIDGTAVNVNGVLPSSLPANTLIYSFDVTAGTQGTIILDATSGSWSGLDAKPGINDGWYGSGAQYGLPYAEVNVVPEPMTMALLGLGGLFLRRRK